MIATTPFHERVSAANVTGLWSHWAGYLVAEKYQMSEKFEYFAIRNSAGIFDTSPLYKYRIRGRDAERYLAGVLARDIRTCRPRQAQYTIWCDDRGFVLEDGVILRHSSDEFFLTTAAPNLAYFGDRVGSLTVEIDDISDEYGALAVQGPASRAVLAALAPEIERLPYFHMIDAKLAGAPVTVSRTGFTGDLGYEIWVRSEDAIAVWDDVVESGTGRGVIPFGQIALDMARIEAGLLLIDTDFHSSRFAWTDEDCSTPHELGLGWMLRSLGDNRPFIGRNALRREVEHSTSRWRTVGLIVEWEDFERRHRDAGVIAPKDHIPVAYEMMLYDDDHHRVGYATSFMYSPMLQRHVGIARVRPELAKPGNRVNLEITINHQYQLAGARVARLPLYRTDRKTG